MKKLFVLLCASYFTTAFAQDLIITNNGETIKAHNVEVGSSHIFYQTDNNPLDSSICYKIKKNQILIIKLEDGTKIDPNKEFSNVNPSANTPAETVEWIKDTGDFPIVDIDSYKGYLLKRGNCVFIPHNSEYDYERAGQNVVYEEIKKTGFWKVVNKPEQAHFILFFFTKTSGRDKTGLFLTTREFYEKYKFNPEQGIQSPSRISVLYEDSDSNISINKKIAHKGIEILKTKFEIIEKEKYKNAGSAMNKFKK